jgi:hypothetical protein
MKTIATTKDSTVRYHYIRNRDPKLLHPLKGGGMSAGAPIACIASRIDRDAMVIEYAVATVHAKKTTNENIVIKNSDLKLSRSQFSAFADDLLHLCKDRGVKVFADRGSVSIAREVPSFDTFSYASGRRIAAGRLSVSHIEIPYDKQPESGLEIMSLIMRSIADDPKTPTKVQREALAWLDYRLAAPERDTVPNATCPYTLIECGASIRSTDPVENRVNDLVSLVNSVDDGDRVPTRSAPPIRKVPRYPSVQYEKR